MGWGMGLYNEAMRAKNKGKILTFNEGDWFPKIESDADFEKRTGKEFDDVNAEIERIIEKENLTEDDKKRVEELQNQKKYV